MAHGPISSEPDEPCPALGTDPGESTAVWTRSAEDVLHEVFRREDGILQGHAILTWGILSRDQVLYILDEYPCGLGPPSLMDPRQSV